MLSAGGKKPGKAKEANRIATGLVSMSAARLS